MLQRRVRRTRAKGPCIWEAVCKRSSRRGRTVDTLRAQDYFESSCGQKTLGEPMINCLGSRNELKREERIFKRGRKRQISYTLVGLKGPRSKMGLGPTKNLPLPTGTENESVARKVPQPRETLHVCCLFCCRKKSDDFFLNRQEICEGRKLCPSKDWRSGATKQHLRSFSISGIEMNSRELRHLENLENLLPGLCLGQNRWII